MSLFIRTEPSRLHKRTWVEKHRAKILLFYGFSILLLLFILASFCVKTTIASMV